MSFIAITYLKVNRFGRPFCIIVTGMQQGSKIRGAGSIGGDNVTPLVEIGLTGPPKSGGRLPPLPPTLLHAC